MAANGVEVVQAQWESLPSGTRSRNRAGRSSRTGDGEGTEPDEGGEGEPTAHYNIVVIADRSSSGGSDGGYPELSAAFYGDDEEDQWPELPDPIIRPPGSNPCADYGENVMALEAVKESLELFREIRGDAKRWNGLTPAVQELLIAQRNSLRAERRALRDIVRAQKAMCELFSAPVFDPVPDVA